jgi:branched-subunit amino acid aminotransferase/4-amino-4-deoxychorismate lyase
MVTKDHALVTPDMDILEGITRQKLLGLAKGLYQVEERPISLDELRHCQEAFITSTTKQVLPVVAIDDRMISNGKAGAVTKALHHALIALQQKADATNVSSKTKA